MKRYIHINEDVRTPKLMVVLDDYIQQKIAYIKDLNTYNQDALNEWLDYIDGLLNYISHRQIAWDNCNRYEHHNGLTYFNDFGQYIVFTIKNDDDIGNYVFVIDMELKTDDYDLILPIYERYRISPINRCVYGRRYIHTIYPYRF